MVGEMGGDLAPVRRGSSRCGDDLEPLDRRVFDALTAHGRRVEHLAVVAGLSVPETQAALGRLDLFGYAVRGSDGWCRRTRV